MEDQRKWIHTHINKMIEEFVMDSVTDINKTHESVRAQVEERNEKKQYPCRSIGCKKIFRYEKCRSHHVQQRHELRFEQEKTQKASSEGKEIKKDCIYNYGCFRPAISLLLRDADDAVKEGDGERLVRVWKFLVYFFKLQEHEKYALDGLRLICSMNGLLTPRQAHQLIWNRFAGRKNGQGTRISRELRLEHLNHHGKQQIRALGFSNITDERAQISTQSINVTEASLTI